MKAVFVGFLIPLALIGCAGKRAAEAQSQDCSPTFLNLYNQIETRAKSTRAYLGFKMTESQLLDRAQGLQKACLSFMPTFEHTECYAEIQGEAHFYRGGELTKICRATSALIEAVKKD